MHQSNSNTASCLQFLDGKQFQYGIALVACSSLKLVVTAGIGAVCSMFVQILQDSIRHARGSLRHSAYGTCIVTTVSVNEALIAYKYLGTKPDDSCMYCSTLGPYSLSQQCRKQGKSPAGQSLVSRSKPNMLMNALFSRRLSTCSANTKPKVWL